MNKKFLALAIVALLTTSFNFASANGNIQYAPAQENNYKTQYPIPVNYQQQPSYLNGNYYNGNTYSQDQLQGNVVLVPANTTFQATTTAPINSESMQTGDNVVLYLASDFYYGKNLIAPAGSKVNGIVIKAKKGGYGKRNGQLQIRFSNIYTPNGQMIPISAQIQTNDGSGTLKGGTKKDAAKGYAGKAVMGAATGAVTGTIMGALSDGSVGKGAAYGTALGGGVGLLTGLYDKGTNVEIPQNAQLNLILNQPITVSSQYQY